MGGVVPPGRAGVCVVSAYMGQYASMYASMYATQRNPRLRTSRPEMLMNLGMTLGRRSGMGFLTRNSSPSNSLRQSASKPQLQRRG